MVWILVIALVVGLTWLALRYNARPLQWSADQVAATLENWADGSISTGEWDQFENCALSDPRLESIRRTCAAMSIDPTYTVDPKVSPELNQAGIARVRGFIDDIRAGNRLSA